MLAPWLPDCAATKRHGTGIVPKQPNTPTHFILSFMKKVKTLRTYFTRAKQNELLLIGNKAVRQARTKEIYDVIKAKKDALEAVLLLFFIALQDALSGSPADTLYKEQVMGQVIDTFNDFADGLDEHCKDDPLYIVYLGLKVQEGASQFDGDPSAPTNFNVATTLVAGEVLATFEILEPAIVTAVVFEYSEDKLAWSHAGQTTSKTRAVLTGLPSRKEIYVRCYCLATKGRRSVESAEMPVFVL